MSRSANFSHAELNVLLTSLETNHELITGELGGRIKNTADQRNEWQRVTNLINSVGEVNRTVNSVRQKWCDLKSKTKKKASDIKNKTNVGNKGLTQLEKRIIRMIESLHDHPRPIAPQTFDISYQEDTYEEEHDEADMNSKESRKHLLDCFDNIAKESLMVRNSPVVIMTRAPKQETSCDLEPSTSQQSSDEEMSPSSWLLQNGTGKLSHKINQFLQRNDKKLDIDMDKFIKTQSNLTETLSDIKLLLQESLSLQRQMLENQKVEIALLAKVANVEMYDE